MEQVGTPENSCGDMIKGMDGCQEYFKNKQLKHIYRLYNTIYLFISDPQTTGWRLRHGKKRAGGGEKYTNLTPNC